MYASTNPYVAAALAQAACDAADLELAGLASGTESMTTDGATTAEVALFTVYYTDALTGVTT